MENSLIVSIIIGTIVMIPGLYGLITQAKKDKLAELNMVSSHFHKINSDRLNELDIRARALEGYITDKEIMPIEISEQQVKRIWDMLYEKPVIVRCRHCGSSNIITNLECIKCGAPIGV